MMTEEEKIREQELTGKIQEKALSVLEHLREILDRNGIEYFLACGTALGCVRHKGFIPWDDDIDIYVMGRDYPKLQQVFKTQNTGSLRLQDFSTVPDYPYWFPKIIDSSTLLVEKAMEHLEYKCGVYVDVFLLQDGYEGHIRHKISEMRRFFDYSLLRFYYRAYDSKLRKLMKKLIRAVVNPMKVQKSLFRQYIRELPGSSLVDIGTFRQQAVLKRSWFDESCSMSFEGSSFKMPSGWEEYLRHYYGDYMQLPPESERVSNHDFSRLVLDAGEGEII